MYCGKNKTALTSQKKIAASLLALMAERPFSEISISQLCKSAGISRQTFYTLFQSKENVITFILESEYCYMPETPASCGGQSDTGNLSALCRGFSVYIVEHAGFLRMLVENDLIHLMHDSLFQSFYSCSCIIHTADHLARRYAAEFMAGGFTGIAQTYVAGEPDRSDLSTRIDELDQITQALFRGKLFS